MVEVKKKQKTKKSKLLEAVISIIKNIRSFITLTHLPENKIKMISFVSYVRFQVSSFFVKNVMERVT